MPSVISHRRLSVALARPGPALPLATASLPGRARGRVSRGLEIALPAISDPEALNRGALYSQSRGQRSRELCQ